MYVMKILQRNQYYYFGVCHILPQQGRPIKGCLVSGRRRPGGSELAAEYSKAGNWSKSQSITISNQNMSVLGSGASGGDLGHSR